MSPRKGGGFAVAGAEKKRVIKACISLANSPLRAPIFSHDNLAENRTMFPNLRRNYKLIRYRTLTDSPSKC